MLGKCITGEEGLADFIDILYTTLPRQNHQAAAVADSDRQTYPPPHPQIRLSGDSNSATLVRSGTLGLCGGCLCTVCWASGGLTNRLGRVRVFGENMFCVQSMGERSYRRPESLIQAIEAIGKFR